MTDIPKSRRRALERLEEAKYQLAVALSILKGMDRWPDFSTTEQVRLHTVYGTVEDALKHCEPTMDRFQQGLF